MDISINDLSFKGQFTSFSEIEACVNDLMAVTQVAEELAGYKPIRRTRGLAERMLTRTESLRSYMNSLYGTGRAADEKLLQSILLTFVKGPFIPDDAFDDQVRGAVSICGDVVDDTALHACFSRKDESVHAVISAPLHPYDSVPEIRVAGNGCAQVPVLNFVSSTQCTSLLRCYDANPKHELKTDKLVNNNVHTKMDLDSDTALACLRDGMQVIGDRYVYGYYNEKWYEFRPHEDGRYHGFPIVDPGNEGTLNRIIRVFGEPPYSPAGYQFCLA
ncbi:hypothetical protein [Klebsiella variicola]|uniref:hypothetical protein n=1 Tax=Klebsiella variicola TaxID=244366 RepID=UPI0007CBDAD8|nr:hypothetical protein [Klebsiella variicola]MCS5958757.1 hypothetical protein [Klebsiella variicola subsp. variicola]MCE7439829.1 hypothetical protein [Klebsiella variicola]MCJ6489209.1 hypothetical protein [Klebsiella variicola]OUG66588.1 hypothetical protein AZZ62_000446 [Klebsiella variicola]SBK35061.1 Uncharacterised protein [Klebsiella variicola]